MKRRSETKEWYHLTLKDWMSYGALGAAGGALTALIFYRHSLAVGILAFSGALIFPQFKKKDLFAKQKRKITLEFKESLNSLSAALRAGQSLENAFASTVEEMSPETHPYLYDHWRKILGKVRLRYRLEDLLMEFAQQTQIDEIQSFAQIIAVSKRTQGEMSRVMDHTISMLEEKIELEQDLEVLLTKKKTEQKIMNLMPFLVIGMLSAVSPEYMAPLYETMRGRVVMIFCAALAFGSIGLARHFSNITI